MQPSDVELMSDKDQDELGSAQRVPDHVAERRARLDIADVDKDFMTG
jgi:hypothetical protein